MNQNTEVVVPKLALANLPVANLPVELGPEARIREELSIAINPIGPIEELMVEVLSRRVAQTRELAAARDVLRDEGEAALLDVSTGNGTSAAASNLARASVLSSERHQALLRQELASTHGAFRAMHEIRDLRASSPISTASLLAPDPRFASEPSCVAYLVRRYRYGRCDCHRCGAVGNGSFIAVKTAWQCAHCHAQTGLRRGTCMQGSPLPLTKWFAAIRIVLLSQTIATEELAAVLKIDRRQTVRNMIGRIRAALSSADPTAALAGLAELYLGIS